MARITNGQMEALISLFDRKLKAFKNKFINHSDENVAPMEMTTRTIFLIKKTAGSL